MNPEQITAYARESAAQAPPLTEQAKRLLAVTLGKTATAAPIRKARR